MNVTRRTMLTGAAALMVTAVVPELIVADDYTDSKGVLQGGWRVRRKPSFRMQLDPLGYDLTDPDGAIRAITEDVLSGRTGEAVQTELEAVRRRFRPLGGIQ